MINDGRIGEYIRLGGGLPHGGGYTTVYMARHEKLGYIRAIRQLKKDILTENDEDYKKFCQECNLLLRLGNAGHANIVRIIQQPKIIDKKAFAEMEWVWGNDLETYIKAQNGFIEKQEVLRFIGDISSALAYCHFDIYQFCLNKDVDTCIDYEDKIDEDCRRLLVNKYQVIHNDVHSKNVMRKFDGSYILLDFGLAIEGSTKTIRRSGKGGVVECKSPERFDGLVIEQGDVYSFGILMYEMLTGEVPFPLSKFTEEKIEYKHRNEKPPEIEPLRKKAFEKKFPDKQWVKDYPDWLEKMIMKCLEKKPENRFPNAKDLQMYFLDCSEAEGISKEHGAMHTNKEVEQLQIRLNELRDTERRLSSEIAKYKKAKNNNSGSSKMAWFLFFSVLLVSVSLLIYLNRNQNSGNVTEIPKDTAASKPSVKDTLSKETVENKKFNLYGEKFIYTGQVLHDLPEGNGEAVFENGDKYSGQFKGGYRNGKGKYSYKSGELLVGNFVLNQMTGMGNYTYNNGYYYTGMFKNSKFNGTGAIYNKDSSLIVEGNFINGKKKP